MSLPPPAYAPVHGPAGRVRGTGVCILLTIVTFGLYAFYWFYAVHDEMRRHTGTGTGGLVALLLAIFAGIVMPFLTSYEAGALHRRLGRREPVSAATGLWALLLGWFFLVGLIVWFVRTNGAINDYWRSVGAAR